MSKPDKIKIELTFTPMKGFGGGFRTEWCSAERDDGTAAGMDSGGGLGNPLLTFWFRPKDGKRVYYTADIRPLIQGLCDAMETP